MSDLRVSLLEAGGPRHEDTITPADHRFSEMVSISSPEGTVGDAGLLKEANGGDGKGDAEPESLWGPGRIFGAVSALALFIAMNS